MPVVYARAGVFVRPCTYHIISYHMGLQKAATLHAHAERSQTKTSSSETKTPTYRAGATHFCTKDHHHKLCSFPFRTPSIQIYLLTVVCRAFLSSKHRTPKHDCSSSSVSLLELHTLPSVPSPHVLVVYSTCQGHHYTSFEREWSATFLKNVLKTR